MNRQPPSNPASPATATPSRAPLIAKGLATLFLLLLSVTGGARLVANQREADALRQRTVEGLKRGVITVRPQRGEATRKVSLPASLRGSAETAIYARSNGYLSAWHKTIGDTVQKGDLLATIDVPELEHELAQARALRGQTRARLDLAKSTLKRWALLHDTDSAPQQEYEEKRSAVLQAQADVEAAEANLKRLQQIGEFRRIVAPFSGVISRRNVDVGNLITAGNQALFALTQTDPLRLTAWVPQAYAEDVRADQAVAVRFPETQGKALPARIEHVAGALDPVIRSRQVDIILPNREGKLLPGAYAEVVLDLPGGAETLMVPANVLVIGQAEPHVATVDKENRIVFRAVRLGRDFGRDVEILEGVAADDVLVASPSDLLAEGETVAPIAAAGPAAAKTARK